MKLQQVERVVRYQVYFEPPEAAILSRHPKWQHRIGRRKSGQPGGDATLTKTELSEVCDVLGVNGREWLANALVVHVTLDTVPSSADGGTVTEAGEQ